MLTRLKISGFKNLVDVDVRFGAFTCIAGANGVGKSNLFDAIRFLSALAQMPLIEAALSVRDGSGKRSDIRNLFHRVGDRYVDKMSFVAEMIIPATGIANFGYQAEAVDTFLEYSLDLIYKNTGLSGSLQIVKEQLVSVENNEINQNFKLKSKTKHTDQHKFNNINEIINQFIYIDKIENADYIHIASYTNKKRDLSNIIIETAKTKHTALSLSENTPMSGEYDTQFLAHQEMISWQSLQLEPSPLRKANEFTAPSKLGTDGSNLAANFYYLVEKYYQQEKNNKLAKQEVEAKVYAQASNRLAELIDDVDCIWIDRDDKRELLTLMVKDKQGTDYSASSLSDGTLRFLALTALELDPDSFRLLCLEEPENGIPPYRIPKILQLLQDMAVDLAEPIGFDNPLRQVIINTHSPAVVQQVPEDSLLIANLEETFVDGQRSKRACFRYLPDTWRDLDSTEDQKSQVISKGKLLSYLNPVSRQFTDNRVVDRPDLQSLLPGN